MNAEEASTLKEALEALESEEKQGKKAPVIRGRSLPLSKIIEIPIVFQPRDMNTDVVNRDRHIQTLITAIYNSPQNRLEPVTVWWSGQRWVLVDGHHRLAAYREVKKQGKIKRLPPIPVEVLEGNYLVAIAESKDRNSRDKRPMSREDKSNSAWQMVAIDKPEYSKRLIARACGVSVPTVGRMRKQLSSFKEAYPDHWKELALNCSWGRAQMLEKEPSSGEELANEMVQQWARRLSKTFGTKPCNQPDIFWEALEVYSPHLAAGIKGLIAPEIIETYDKDDFDF